MAKKHSKNSRAARRGETEAEIEVAVPKSPEIDGKTRVLQELAIKQTRSEDSLKPKTVSKTKSKAKSKREKQKRLKGEAFSDILAEKVKTSGDRHKKIKAIRKDED